MCFLSLFKSAEQNTIDQLTAFHANLKQFDSPGEQNLAALFHEFSKVLGYLIGHRYIQQRKVTTIVVHDVMKYADKNKTKASDYDARAILLAYPRLKKQFDIIKSLRIRQSLDRISQTFCRLSRTLYQAQKDSNLQGASNCSP
jgi:hypothetical protein